MRYPTPLPPEPSGNSKETTWFRQLLKAIRERSVKVGPGLRASYNVNETLIELERAQIAGGTTTTASESQRYYIDEVQDSYLLCRVADETGVPSGNQVKIAKPENLRVTTGSATYVSQNARKRFITGNAYVAEEIDPAYDMGDFIYADEPEGKTGVTIDGAILTLLDENRDARHWRASYTLVSVCVNEGGTLVTRTMYVAGGPAS